MDDLLARLLDKVENRYYGKYRGFVAENADPDLRGRLKLKIPSVLGNEEVSGWAMPCVPYGGMPNQGSFFSPEVGAGVWVEFEAGNIEYPIWVGTFWSNTGDDSEVPKPNDADGTEQSAVQNPPTRKIIKTVKGHTVQIEDKDEEDLLLLFEATNKNIVAMNKDGITIIDGPNSTDSNKQQIVLSSTGVTLTDLTGNAIEMTDSAFNITSKVALTIDASGQSITIIGKTIDLNKG
jgi:uncharacterized protein involved in type VI secretion and phage assembly